VGVGVEVLVALEVGVGVALIVGVAVAVAVLVGRGVGVGRAVWVGVGTPPIAHRSAAALQLGPLKIVRLTMLLLKVTPLVPFAQQYLPVGLVRQGESALHAKTSLNIRQMSASFVQVGLGSLEHTAGLFVL